MDAHNLPATSTSPSTRISVPLAVGAAALLVAAPTPAAALRALGVLRDAPVPPPADSDPTGLVVAVLALLAWALITWLATGLALVCLGRLPGLTGRVAAAVAAQALPTALRRSLEIALGASLALGTVGAAPALAAVSSPAAGPSTGSSSGPVAVVNLDWPGQASVPADPTSASSARPAAAVRPATAPGVRAGLVVQPGDTLWSLAKRSLQVASGSGRSSVDPTDAQVATAWPSWWAANRAVIGDDPDLLRPGTALVTPPAAP